MQPSAGEEHLNAIVYDEPELGRSSVKKGGRRILGGGALPGGAHDRCAADRVGDQLPRSTPQIRRWKGYRLRATPTRSFRQMVHSSGLHRGRNRH